MLGSTVEPLGEVASTTITTPAIGFAHTRYEGVEAGFGTQGCGNEFFNTMKSLWWAPMSPSMSSNLVGNTDTGGPVVYGPQRTWLQVVYWLCGNARSRMSSRRHLPLSMA